MIHDTALNEYYLAGDAESGDGDFSNAQGDADFAVIKLKIPMPVDTDSVVCDLETYVPYTDTLPDRCGYDSVIVTYRPVLLQGPFDGVRNADTIFAGQQVTLHSNGNGTVTWTPHPTLSCTDCPDPVATPLSTTVYTATNMLPGGCRASDNFTVVVLRDAMVQVPTAFTPNRDGLNDFFGPIGKVPGGYKLQIYNRNGEIVFSSTTMYSKWNGLFRGALQPAGVFIYLIEYKDIQNRLHQQKGTFVLIR
jgi:gliding motility-associated-like protein